MWADAIPSLNEVDEDSRRAKSLDVRCDDHEDVNARHHNRNQKPKD